MRTEPSEKSLQAKQKLTSQERIDKITRIVAIIVAFASTFVFFFKILFF